MEGFSGKDVYVQITHTQCFLLYLANKSKSKLPFHNRRDQAVLISPATLVSIVSSTKEISNLRAAIYLIVCYIEELIKS